MLGIDVNETKLSMTSPGLLEALLTDRSTGKNIIWATDNYVHLGPGFAAPEEIRVDSITGVNAEVIQPRVAKSTAHRWDRTKAKAEVFTPSWLCNEQNSRVDDAWFGRTGVFNTISGREWTASRSRVEFDPKGPRTWKRYVDERRLEATCGEAPYLVSRYDATTGAPIELGRRIGLLDRKLRVVTENTNDEREWSSWTRRAFESVYGYEIQGDSLLLARENLLATYIDYATSALGHPPQPSALLEISTVISWNLWQMDGLTGLPPFQASEPATDQLDLFGDWEAEKSSPCMLRDWRAERAYTYQSLTTAEKGSP